jgi:hypothetical protein
MSAASGCGKNTAQNSNTSEVTDTYTLPSGRRIKITSISRMNFTESDPALVMNYQTEIPIENREELRKEKDEVWAIFQTDANNSHLKSAVIKASHMEDDGIFVKHSRTYGFVFHKQDDGTWVELKKEGE